MYTHWKLPQPGNHKSFECEELQTTDLTPTNDKGWDGGNRQKETAKKNMDLLGRNGG
jgi:hypothetical protein